MKLFHRDGSICLALGLVAALAGMPAGGQSKGVNVLTQAYDIARSGTNPAEQTLSPTTVSSATFGKLFSFAVDDEVFAQPLFVSALNIAGGTHDTVFIATAGNSVFAFDAENPSTANSPLWSINLGPPVPAAKYIYLGDVSHFGIVGTPVIDPTTNTLYVVAQVWDTSTQTATHQLHALDITSGSEKFGGPVQISGTGFDPAVSWPRSGLLLVNSVVYVPVSSYGDSTLNVATGNPSEFYHGLLIAYDAGTLAQLAIFNAEPNGSGGAIWQSARGPASDGTYVYAMTSNASRTGTGNIAESFVKLNPSTLSVADSFADPNAACLNSLDFDLGSSGPLIMLGTGTSLLAGGGKQGKVYVFQLDQPLMTQTPQTFWGTSHYTVLPADGGTCSETNQNNQGSIGAAVAFWNNTSGPLYYIFGGADELRSYQLSANVLTQQSADTPTNVWPNALAVSANGSAGGILWVVTPQPTGLAVVHAFNATPSSGHLTELWNTSMVANRDILGYPGRHTPPTVANGRVYVASLSNQVAVYGLLPTSPTLQLSALSPTLRASGLGTTKENIALNSLGGFVGNVTLSLSGLPAGATYTFTKSTIHVASGASLKTVLSVSLSSAVLPLADAYTLVVQGTAGKSTSYAPIRLYARGAAYTSISKLACNSSNQMSASLSFNVNGSGGPSIWIQDPSSPTFPGRLWMDVPANGSEQTGYWINDRSHNYFYWIMDQSAGGPANFDNALTENNLRKIYSCP
jgi:hypothetical protein